MSDASNLSGANQSRPVDERMRGVSDAEFNAVFEQHWPRVNDLLYRMLGDPAEAEDLALETFVRLHRRPPPDWERLGGWLYRTATNLALNALRARRRRRHYEETAGLAEMNAQPPGDPAALFEQAQERARVRQTLVAMRPRRAQLLVLRSAGFSYAEIAAALEIAPASVGSLLARAEHEFEQRYRAS